MKVKFESTYDEYFPEESAKYYEILLKYANLTDVDGKTAGEIARQSLVYSDRYNTIANDGGKVENIKGSKTEKHDFFYGRYRTLQKIHAHCVEIWSNANWNGRNYGKGM